MERLWEDSSGHLLTQGHLEKYFAAFSHLGTQKPPRLRKKAGEAKQSVTESVTSPEMMMCAAQRLNRDPTGALEMRECRMSRKDEGRADPKRTFILAATSGVLGVR